jgi:hypothetical protein
MRTLGLTCLLIIVSCGTESTGGDDAPPPGGGDPTSGTSYPWLADSIDVPTTGNEAQNLGFNLDEDVQGEVDNLFGSILSSLVANGLDPQGATDQAVGAGLLVQLHEVTADSLVTDSSARWRTFIGDPLAAAPVYDGTDAAVISEDDAAGSTFIGSIGAGNFHGSAETASLELALTGTGRLLHLELVGAQLGGAVESSGCSGVIGGGVTQQYFYNDVAPQLVDLMNEVIDEDEGCQAGMTACTTAAARNILDNFDTNEDLEIGLDEFRDSQIVLFLFAPDVDLLNDPDEDGVGPVAVNVDGIRDSLSIGVGFTCVGATFTAP